MGLFIDTEKYLNSKEFDDWLEEYIKKEEKRERELVEFRQGRIHEVIEELDEATDIDQICSDDYTWEHKFTRKEFGFIFEIIYDYAIDKDLLYYDDENYFSQGIVTIKHKGNLINFNRMVGQGTVDIISKREIIEEDKIIEFEDVLK